MSGHPLRRRLAAAVLRLTVLSAVLFGSSALAQGGPRDPGVRLDAGRFTIVAEREDGDPVRFEALVRLDTPNEIRYFQNGGILQTVLRDLRSA